MADNNGDGFDDETGDPVGPTGGGVSSGGGNGFARFGDRAYREALQKIAALVRRFPGAQIYDDTHVVMPNGRIRTIQADAKGEPALSEEWTAAATAQFFASVGAGGDGGGSGGGSGGGGSRMASDDPRYWQLQYDQLAAQLMNSGLDAESARRQALATLIANRNNTATDIAATSANVAKTQAEFAANPRDVYAEAYYANQVGGSTPFGDLGNKAFGEYGKTLAEKAERIFSPVNTDLNAARGYRDAIPQPDFFGPETRQQLNLAPTPAQALTGGTGGGLPASTAPAPDILTQMTDRLKAMSPEDQAAFLKYVTPMAKGGQIDFDGMVKGREMMGASPSSSEGGTNMNIHERAIIVGESGKVYGMMGEKREDGTVRAEQLIIKPLPSEVKKDKKLEEAGKAIVETQKKTMASFATGGSVAATPDDLLAEFQKFMSRIGGAGGGSETPFGGSRFLAGAPANELLDNPFAKAITEATYSAKGVSPEQLWSEIAKFTPKSAQLVGQTAPRTSWI